MNEHPLPRTGQYVVAMDDFVRWLEMPDDQTPVAITASRDGQSVSVLVQSDKLAEQPWNCEPPIIWRERVQVTQSFDIEDGGPVFERSAPAGSDEARIMDDLTQERFDELLAAKLATKVSA